MRECRLAAQCEAHVVESQMKAPMQSGDARQVTNGGRDEFTSGLRGIVGKTVCLFLLGGYGVRIGGLQNVLFFLFQGR